MLRYDNISFEVPSINWVVDDDQVNDNWVPLPNEDVHEYMFRLAELFASKGNYPTISYGRANEDRSNIYSIYLSEGFEDGSDYEYELVFIDGGIEIWGAGDRSPEETVNNFTEALEYLREWLGI